MSASSYFTARSIPDVRDGVSNVYNYSWLSLCWRALSFFKLRKAAASVAKLGVSVHSRLFKPLFQRGKCRSYRCYTVHAFVAGSLERPMRHMGFSTQAQLLITRSQTNYPTNSSKCNAVKFLFPRQYENTAFTTHAGSVDYSCTGQIIRAKVS